MLKGRLGLESARIPQRDRHGLLWVGRGNLSVRNGTLIFTTAGFEDVPAGTYDVPFQMLSCILMQPGTTVTHDALRLMARHGTGLVAVAEGGVRFYASLPLGPDRSARARRQAEIWATPEERMKVVRRMYAWRLGEVVPDASLDELRGLEGARMRATYRLLAEQHGCRWKRRYFDRDDPMKADLPNQAINHAAITAYAAAQVAVAVCGAIPQLGFIHEDSGIAFCLDIADLVRDSYTLPLAFSAAASFKDGRDRSIEKDVRRLAAKNIRQRQLVCEFIDRIKDVLDGDDDHRDP